MSITTISYLIIVVIIVILCGKEIKSCFFFFFKQTIWTLYDVKQLLTQQQCNRHEEAAHGVDQRCHGASSLCSHAGLACAQEIPKSE